MDPIKLAFKKAKQDIFQLQSEIFNLKKEINDLREAIKQTDKPTNRQTHPSISQTEHQITQTEKLNEHNNLALEGQKSPNSTISIGNRGVPTDKQTHQQTDQHIQSPSINRLSDTLSSLDEIKRTLRKQFKQLTTQEMLIFSTLYQLEDEGFTVDYAIISQKLNLSESSIRDYIIKITKKGIPITKNKENNKKILLSIPLELRKIATLQTIIELRDI
jgi:hypothetical protein